MDRVLWGVPPWDGWYGGAIKITGNDVRRELRRRRREGWTALEIRPDRAIVRAGVK